MIFRKAEPADVPAIAAIYEGIHDLEEKGAVVTGWLRGVYPTEATARLGVTCGDMYICEDAGSVIAAARINAAQDEAYAAARWQHEAPPEQVLVLHTLVVSPVRRGQGAGRAFVAFYEALAHEAGRPYLRMDTNERNLAARKLYRSLGYREADVVPCAFNGIDSVRLVCLEKKL